MSDLSTFHLQRMERISSGFFETGDGLRAVRDRSRAVDQIVAGMFDQRFPECPPGFAVLAVGGYGRGQLFPHSDVDLLFLCASESLAKRAAEPLSELLTSLWDARLRVSQSVRTPAECSRWTPENAELHVSLLDCRFIAGDEAVYRDFSHSVLPRFFNRERKSLMRSLVKMATERHRRFGRTIYHLEPDVKEAPGGLRDLQLACWISQLARARADRVPTSEEHLPAVFHDEFESAKRFLFSLRCYLHYFAGRDSNKLAFDLQDAIASDGSGKGFRPVRDAADWMRDYFRSARTIHRLALRVIDEFATPENSLFAILRDRRSRLSNEEATVARGRVFARGTARLEQDPAAILRLIRFVGRHGVPLAFETEQAIVEASPEFKVHLAREPRQWRVLADILRQPFAYRALVEMRDTGVLFALLPELRGIDCLALRDFYHRYTVDEHTFLAINVLKRLPEAEDAPTRRFARLAAETGGPATLYFALLFHDAGKGDDATGDHAQRGVALADAAMERLGFNPHERATTRFLVERHLTMSEFLSKRDISDPDTAAELAEIVGTIERLRALTLITYADVSAVNPDVMTPWRKQLLWRLYLGAHNRLTADAEDRRIGADSDAPILAAATSAEEQERLRRFLDGFPERYARVYSPPEILDHSRLAAKLTERDAAVEIRRVASLYEVTVLTADRPGLFASLCAAFAGAALNIERAEAFANRQGLVLDIFHAAPAAARGGLDLDDADLRRLKSELRAMAAGRGEPRQALRRRRSEPSPRSAAPIEARVACDNESSSRATIFHVTAEDRVGLLYDLAGAFSRHGCDIEVVLIETQGRQAFDAFYVVKHGAKLAAEEIEALTAELRGACRARAA